MDSNQLGVTPHSQSDCLVLKLGAIWIRCQRCDARSNSSAHFLEARLHIVPVRRTIRSEPKCLCAFALPSHPSCVKSDAVEQFTVQPAKQVERHRTPPQLSGVNRTRDGEEVPSQPLALLWGVGAQRI